MGVNVHVEYIFYSLDLEHFISPPWIFTVILTHWSVLLVGQYQKWSTLQIRMENNFPCIVTILQYKMTV